MKKYVLITVLVMLAAQFGCQKNSTYFIDDETPDLKGVMTLTRNCSGDWLEFEGKAYDVCNYATVTKFAQGTKLLVGANKGCDYDKYPSRQVCYIGRSNDGGTVTIVSLQPVK